MFIFPAAGSYSQENINSVIDLTLSFRGLSREDITIPLNFDKDKSPTNNSKLLLPLVKNLMLDPMSSLKFSEDAAQMSGLEIRELLLKLIMTKDSADRASYFNSEENKITNSLNYPDLKKELVSFCSSVRDKNLITEKKFSEQERKFISKNLFSIISDSEEEDGSSTDIFKFNEARDSSIAVSKRTMDILSSHYSNEMIKENLSEFIFCSTLFEILKRNSPEMIREKTEFLNNEYVTGDFIFYYDKDNIRIAIGGSGKNSYTGHFDLIIDAGGDDQYDIFRSDNENIFRENFSCIIDLSGNDFYRSNQNFNLAGSVFSSGFIFDAEGDDTYRGRNVSLGSAIFGTGILWDGKGNDIYQGDKFTEGSASFGCGILFDREGNDVYTGNSYSQGFGMTEGIGVISDKKGNDSYLIDARSLDIGRYEDHYVSMSQGYGLGLRPYYAGGIGMILEGEGNDIYNTDIFGQGGAYWYGLGIISDLDGNDKYNSYQYAQGAGIHLAVGILNDRNGWDFYSSNGVSQGCGHDYGFGLLYDENGNDNYSAYSLSQGAGNANGIGIFIDKTGRDGYLNKEPGNTRGYGNSRREYGSLGIFIDASGDDFYSSRKDSIINNSSMWGVMNDYFLKDESTAPSGSNYKVPLDSGKQYSTEEYFVMAKTIEPRFSLWQEYGFRKLVQDSSNTSEYILKYLDTDDHRAGLVLRNLAFKIGYSMGNILRDKLRIYNISMQPSSVFNENEVAYICYLFGETGNPSGREEILDLTHNSSARIRSVAINALGKLKIDSADFNFREKVISRLSELVFENSGTKIIQKDLAFAFGNYKDSKDIPALVKLMSSDYFGARFLAADELKTYGDTYSDYINDDLIKSLTQSRTSFHSFLTSIENLSDEKFEEVIDKTSGVGIFYEDGIQLYLIDILSKKIRNSDNEEFRTKMGKTVNDFQLYFPLKIN
ncbi:MAG: hypothetical protein JSS91_12430 [Bacteroidetes bacterium]|nr:hypothetical protein [Bacteroidota bacterium]